MRLWQKRIPLTKLVKFFSLVLVGIVDELI